MNQTKYHVQTVMITSVKKLTHKTTLLTFTNKLKIDLLHFIKTDHIQIIRLTYTEALINRTKNREILVKNKTQINLCLMHYLEDKDQINKIMPIITIKTIKT